MRSFLWRASKWIVGLTLAVALVLYLFVFDVWTVPGDDPSLTAAIAPTLAPGDLLLVTKSVSGGDGDLLRCADPQVPGRYVIARQAGKPGSTIEFAEHDTMKVDGAGVASLSCTPPRTTVEDPTSHVQTDLDC
ncbi:MAG: S26 family signal peptidase [Polyangiaceae bacterium]